MLKGQAVGPQGRTQHDRAGEIVADRIVEVTTRQCPGNVRLQQPQQIDHGTFRIVSNDPHVRGGHGDLGGGVGLDPHADLAVARSLQPRQHLFLDGGGLLTPASLYGHHPPQRRGLSEAQHRHHDDGQGATPAGAVLLQPGVGLSRKQGGRRHQGRIVPDVGGHCQQHIGQHVQDGPGDEAAGNATPAKGDQPEQDDGHPQEKGRRLSQPPTQQDAEALQVAGAHVKARHADAHLRLFGSERHREGGAKLRHEEDQRRRGGRGTGQGGLPGEAPVQQQVVQG